MAHDAWVSLSLEKLASEITVGFVGSMVSEYRRTGIPFLRSRNIEPFRINSNDLQFIGPEFHARLAKSRIKPGDVVIVRTGTPGISAVVPEWLDDANCADLVIVRTSNDLDAHFLVYYLNSVALHHIDSRLVGAVQQHFNVGSARELPVVHPPVAEQRRIVEVLRSIDDKIELNRRMNQTLESMAHAIFRSWFVDFEPVVAKAAGRQPFGMSADVATLFPSEFHKSELGAVPKGWTVESIGDRASRIQYGYTQSASRLPVGPKFLRITDIQGGRVDWGTVPYCECSPKDFEAYRICAGDILVARTGASTGENIYIADAPIAVFASYLVRVQFANRGVARVVGQFMRTEEYFNYIDGSIGGSAQPNAGAPVLTGARLVFPPAGIAEAFCKVVESCDLQRLRNMAESRTLAALRDALLPKLMSGELRVRDAEKLAASRV